MPTTRTKKDHLFRVGELARKQETQKLEQQLETLEKMLAQAGISLTDIATNPQEALNLLLQNRRVMVRLQRLTAILGRLYARLSLQENSSARTTAVKSLWIFLNTVNSEQSLVQAKKPTPYIKGKPRRIR